MGAASQMHGCCGGQVSGQQGLQQRCAGQGQAGDIPDTAQTQVQLGQGPGSASKPCHEPPSTWLPAQSLTSMAPAEFIEVLMPGNCSENAHGPCREDKQAGKEKVVALLPFYC